MSGSRTLPEFPFLYSSGCIVSFSIFFFFCRYEQTMMWKDFLNDPPMKKFNPWNLKKNFNGLFCSIKQVTRLKFIWNWLTDKRTVLCNIENVTQRVYSTHVRVNVRIILLMGIRCSFYSLFFLINFFFFALYLLFSVLKEFINAYLKTQKSCLPSMVLHLLIEN